MTAQDGNRIADDKEVLPDQRSKEFLRKQDSKGIGRGWRGDMETYVEQTTVWGDCHSLHVYLLCPRQAECF
jgi:hypothetical protein